jgi:uncharacterized protein (DUF2235 family)
VEDADAAFTVAPRRIVHVVVMDGTLSSLEEGFETNVGLAYRLLKRNAGPGVTLHYQPGLQFDRGDLLASAWSVLTGSGLDLQIQQVYGALASRYQPGDEIFLIGHSRGAFAEDCCHLEVRIAAIGVWDTVKALGLRLPGLWWLFKAKYQFHNHQISARVGAGFQAMALDETRDTYRPKMWDDTPDRPVHLQQVWFVGNNGDVGGQVMGSPQTRPLSNIPFVWLMQRLQDCGLPLPKAWEDEFTQDVHAPSTGNWSGLNWLFWARSRRVVGRFRSESLHPSVADRRPGRRIDLHNDTGG